jgi:hypothetical protein
MITGSCSLRPLLADHGAKDIDMAETAARMGEQTERTLAYAGMSHTSYRQDPVVGKTMPVTTQLSPLDTRPGTPLMDEQAKAGARRTARSRKSAMEASSAMLGP